MNWANTVKLEIQKMYKFLFYKLFRFAKAQEDTVYVEWGFITLALIFQLIHIAIILLLMKTFWIKSLSFSEPTIAVICLIAGIVINYLIFIQSKLIFKLNSEFQNQKRLIWRDNLLFVSYVAILFVVMFATVW